MMIIKMITIIIIIMIINYFPANYARSIMYTSHYAKGGAVETGCSDSYEIIC